MFRIGEFSKLTQVSIRMLRYYDETGLFKPADIDRDTNYRLYSAKQIVTLNKIVFLRDLGFSTSEIAVALAKWDDDFISKSLDSKRREIETRIQSGQEKLSRIEIAQRDIRMDRIAVNYSVSLKSIPSYQVFSLRRIVPDYYAESMLWKELSAFAKENQIPISDNTFTIYYDEEYREQDVDMEVCAPVARFGTNIGGFTYRNTKPIPIMACTLVNGPFTNIAGAFYAFADWLQGHNQYRMIGHTRQIVHRGPWNEESPDRYLTEIQIPLKKR